MYHKFLTACGAYPKGTAQRAVKNLQGQLNPTRRLRRS